MASIDVFLCTLDDPSDKIRCGLRNAVFSRWGQEFNTNLISVTPIMIGSSNRQFQGQRRIWCEERTESDIYVCAEDDCMPLGRDFATRGVALMHKYSDYSILTANLLPGQWEYRNYPEEIIDVPHLGTGGINFIRKGTLRDILPYDGRFFDEAAQTAAARSHGLRVGIMRDIPTNHLGTGLSTLWPQPYTGKTQIADRVY